MLQVESRVESKWFQLLQLKYDKLLPSFAFNFNLRPYTLGRLDGVSSADYNSINETRAAVYKISQSARHEADKKRDGDVKYTVVGWCKLKTVETSVAIALLKRLKLKHDKLLSKFAFNFNLRRYSVVTKTDTEYEGGTKGHIYVVIVGTKVGCCRSMVSEREMRQRV